MRTGFGRASDGLRTGFGRASDGVRTVRSVRSVRSGRPARFIRNCGVDGRSSDVAHRCGCGRARGPSRRPAPLLRASPARPPTPRHPDTPSLLVRRPRATVESRLGKKRHRAASCGRACGSPGGPPTPPPCLPGRRATRSGPWDTGSSTPVTLVCGCPCTTGVTSSRDLCGWPPERLGPETGSRSARAHGSPSGPQSRRPSPSPLEVDAAPLSG